MCSHRLAVAKLVREYKEPLFSPVSSQISRQNKQELWEHIRQQAVSHGAVQYARKSWKEIRDCVWAPIRRDTMAKLSKARTVGADTVMFTEIDRVVLEIIGTNGTEGGGDMLDDSGMMGATAMGASGMANRMATTNAGMAQLDDDNLNISALVAELSTEGASSASAGNNGEFKPMSSLCQMIGGLDQFAAALNGGGVGGGHHQQQAVPTEQQHSVMNGGSKQQQQLTIGDIKAPKRRAPDLASMSSSSPLFHPPPSPTPFNKHSPDLEKAMQQAQLEQIRLQNLLIQEQIEEKRLQNQLLRMDLQKRQKEANSN